jgi:glycosyltransferase involved in cell wall biosynthesis
MSQDPLISVVVATRDRADRLSRLLESLRSQTLDRSLFEVVVVNDGSRDETAAVLERELARGELRLSTLAHQHGRGPSAARNAGWRAARGPIVAFTDDDCSADSRWLESLKTAIEAHPGAFVQGRTEPAPDERRSIGPFSRTLEVTELGPFFQTCNVAYPHSLLEALGGFDEVTFGRHPGGEDTDLAWRAIDSGTAAVFADDALVFHAVNQLGPIGGLRFPLRWSDTMAVFGRHPAMRSQLHRGIFWKRSHLLLLGAMIGILAARRFPPAALLAYPYARDVLRRTRRKGLSPASTPYLAMQDSVELYATIRGAARHRVLVL